MKMFNILIGLAMAIVGVGLLTYIIFAPPKPDISTATTTYYCGDGECSFAEYAELQIKDIYQVQLKQITHRLDALDSGKEKRWSCAHVYDSRYTLYFDGRPSAVTATSTEQIVIKTIGGEMPVQLGYANCEEIPNDVWSITKDPINK